MIINKIEIELYQEADNEIGSEIAQVIINPALIGLFDKAGDPDFYYTIKSEHGFSFNDFEEVKELFDKLEEIVKLAK